VPQYDFVVQVWTLDGARVYLSRPGAALPAAATLGLSTVDAPRGRWRVFGIVAQGHVIQVGQPLKVREERAVRLALSTLAPFGLLMPALALFAWWIVGRSLRPLDVLAQSVRARRPDALDPLPVAGVPEEIRPLVDATNELLARLEAMLRHERAFIADAAHELRTPLTALSLQLQALEVATPGAAAAAARQQLTAGVARATRLVEQLLSLARHQARPHGERAPVPLHEVAREAVLDLVRAADAKHVDLGITHSDPACCSGSEYWMSSISSSMTIRRPRAPTRRTSAQSAIASRASSAKRSGMCS